MAPLRGFSDNPLLTREDVVRAAEAFLMPLTRYFSPARARVKLPVHSGTHFDETAAQLEGFSRPLWVISALLMGGDANPGIVELWIEGFEAGTDPAHPEYWGDIQDHDQRMVEAEMISVMLLAAPRERFWYCLSRQAQQNLISWLLSMNRKKMPPANWLWFRVFANLALLRTCEINTEEVRRQMADDLNNLDSFYMGEGWSSDGLWRSEELDREEWDIFQRTGKAHALRSSRSADYYSGSFAIQFSQLLYVRFAADLDPVRAERYRQQARDFGSGFWRFFDHEGAVVPFGRSLTYRFACGGFFAALALAAVPDMPDPLSTQGAVKGFLLRHLRWWARNSAEIFHTDGTLNLGWLYPNMYMTEDYNSPQSVYWALKSLIVVGLTKDHPFWTEQETMYPALDERPNLRSLKAPRQILCRGNHHFMLSTSQFSGLPFKAAAAKYGKFAYSSAFGFSVPTGQASLEQIAPDNMLALSKDGTQTWASKYKCEDAEYSTATLFADTVEKFEIAKVRWYPWVERSLEVTTTVIPPTMLWPDWHIRIHRLQAPQTLHRVFTAEGGFAIYGRCRTSGLVPPAIPVGELDNVTSVGDVEGIVQSENSVLILSHAGVSGVTVDVLDPSHGSTTVSPFKPDPNTNLMTPRTLIPMVEHKIEKLQPGQEMVLVTKIFAIPSTTASSNPTKGKSLRELWEDKPQITHELSGPLERNCISLRF